MDCTADSRPSGEAQVRRLLYLSALLALTACATQTGPQRSAPPPATVPATSPSPEAVERLQQEVAQATRLFRDQQWSQADAALTSIVAATEFSALPAAQQHAVLQLAGRTAMEMSDPRRGLSLLQRACGMSEATSFDWYARLLAAGSASDRPEMVKALTVLAVRWPDMLPALEKTGALDYAMQSLKRFGSDGDSYAVLSALFGVRLVRQHAGESGWWQDLALLQLGRGEREAAAGSLLRVADPYIAITIEADRRFDPIRGLLGAWPTVATTAGREIDTAAKRAQDNPGELEPRAYLARLLGNSLRFAEELGVADAAIERQETAGSKAFSDYDKQYTWILEYRAQALRGLGRWDAALIQERAASELPEHGTPNVSQLINLAGMYTETGKPAESQEALARVRSRGVSPYGEMQAQKVTLIAAVQLHDTKSVNEALGFMRRHRDDAPGALQKALLASGHENECAQLLISRLADPRLRSEALRAVQQYDAGAVTPWLVEMDHRWQSLVARRDVQDAIARVGRVGHYPLDRPGY